MNGIKFFWFNIVPPALTAWGTGSGLATLPVNLVAAKKIGIPEDIKDVVVNIGASVHSDGHAWRRSSRSLCYSEFLECRCRTR